MCIPEKNRASLNQNIPKRQTPANVRWSSFYKLSPDLLKRLMIKPPSPDLLCWLLCEIIPGCYEPDVDANLIPDYVFFDKPTILSPRKVFWNYGDLPKMKAARSFLFDSFVSMNPYF